MPVITTPSTPAPTSLVADSNSTSTAGRQEFTGGSSLVASSSPQRRARRCASRQCLELGQQLGAQDLDALFPVAAGGLRDVVARTGGEGLDRRTGAVGRQGAEHHDRQLRVAGPDRLQRLESV